MIVRTSFPRESLFAPKYRPRFQGVLWKTKQNKTQILHLSALSSPENLAKDGVTTEDAVLRSTWQVAGQNKL